MQVRIFDVGIIPQIPRPRPCESVSLINDDQWYRKTFLPTVADRGQAIIQTRGLSSAASAASAAIDHIHDWVLGSDGDWVTMGVVSDG
ncbi:MAG TPA: hypothetical protein EYN92_02785, partial [Dehalococcoidia bacterium]|nr:hypothetical protein [Dehalococcoidia bacterium]